MGDALSVGTRSIRKTIGVSMASNNPSAYRGDRETVGIKLSVAVEMSVGVNITNAGILSVGINLSVGNDLSRQDYRRQLPSVAKVPCRH